MQCDNQLVKERQIRGELPADKRGRCIVRRRRLVARWKRRVERTRGGGSVTTGVMQQPAGKQEANRREAFTDKSRRIVKRTRSSSGAMKGIVTTSRRHHWTRGSGILKAGGTLRERD
jgi:hypothetical protein